MTLKQLENDFKIKGYLKSKDLKIGDGKKPGTLTISGHIVVEYEDAQGNLNQHRISLFASDTTNAGTENKMFAGYKTILDQFVSVDDVLAKQGKREDADFIEVVGELSGNDYVSSKTNALISSTEIRGRFVNRIKDVSDRTGSAIGNIGVVVDSFIDEMNAEGEPTGRKHVRAYSVGYGERVQELQNLVVGEDVAEAFESMYYPGASGVITIEPRHFATTTTVENSGEQVGFGKQMERAVTNWTNELFVTGGYNPWEDEAAVSEEDFILIKEKRKADLAAKAAQTPKQNINPQQGFGTKTEQPSSFGKPATVQISEEDLPF